MQSIENIVFTQTKNYCDIDIDNLVISALYIILILKPQTNVNLLSTLVAWLKMIGTGMNSVMMFLHFHSPEMYAGAYLLHILCTFVFVLDCLYIYWLVVRKRTGQPILYTDFAH